MAPTKHCSYGLCNSDARYDHREAMQGVFFVPIAKPCTDRCKSCLKCQNTMQWVRACGRPDEQFNINCVTRNTYICSLHFVGRMGPTTGHPAPVPAAYTQEQLERLSRKRWGPTDRSQSAKKLEVKKRKTLDITGGGDKTAEDISVAESLLQLSNCQMNTQAQPENIPAQYKEFRKPEVKDIGIQTEGNCFCQSAAAEKMDSVTAQNDEKLSEAKITENIQIMSLDKIKNNDKEMKFFTGLTYLQFTALFKFLGPAVNSLIYSTSWSENKTTSNKECASNKSTACKSNKRKKRKTMPQEELFITLVKLRRAFGYASLSHLFSLSTTTLQTICTTWLQFLYCHFNGLRFDMFPSRQHLQNFAPKCMQSITNLRCSVDCVEFFVQMPRDIRGQDTLNSDYKHHQSLKCLIAVAPNGAGVFCSDLYEGGISDRDIFEQSGIMQFLHSQDLVLADRGFTVHDLLNSIQVNLNIPPVLNSREKLPGEEDILTRRMETAREHVGLFNEKLKEFRLIGNKIPLSLTSMANQLVFVAFCLVNFQEPLIS